MTTLYHFHFLNVPQVISEHFESSGLIAGVIDEKVLEEGTVHTM